MGSLLEDRTKKRNYTIEIARLFAAVLVVSIHTHPLSDVDPTLGFIASSVLPRPAVPLFFLISGYYFFRSDNKLRMIWRTTLSYSIVSIIYYLVDVISNGGGDRSSYGIINRILDYFIFGSWYHLWFFPAMIFSMLIAYAATILYKKKLLFNVSLILYVIGVIGCAYYQYGIKIPLLNKLYLCANFDAVRRIFLMGLPFFCMGMYMDDVHRYFKYRRKKIIVLIIVLLFCIETYTVVSLLKCEKGNVLTFFLYPLVALIFDYLLYDKFHDFKASARYSAETSKIIYFYHPLLLMIPLIRRQTQTFQFIITIFSLLLVGFAVFDFHVKIKRKPINSGVEDGKI